MSFLAMVLILADGVSAAAIDPNKVKWDDLSANREHAPAREEPLDAGRVSAQTEVLGPGPYTLVISDGSVMTKVEYQSGQRCARARDEVVVQVDPSRTNTNPRIIYGPPRVQAFCVRHP